MDFIGIIPARYASSRFPGKVLCDLDGWPLIKHVYESAALWNKWKALYVAADDKEVQSECYRYGIPVCMTSPDHLDCLDRANEAVQKMKSEGNSADRYIIIQGDEPFFNAETLDVDLSPPIVSFYTKVTDEEELYGTAASNAVKVVVSNAQKAIYFSRYTLPYHDLATKRSADKPKFFKQVGVYSFSAEMLKIYSTLSPSHLECMEGVGLMRFIENDIDVHVRYTKFDSVSVDTEEDRQRALKILKTTNHWDKIRAGGRSSGNSK